MKQSILLIGLLASAVACESSSNGDGTGGQGPASNGGRTSGGAPATGGAAGGVMTGGSTSGTASGGVSTTGGTSAGGASAGGTSAGGTSAGGRTSAGGSPSGGSPSAGAGSGGRSGGTGGAAPGGQTSSGGQANQQTGGGPGAGGGTGSGCVGKEWTTADPTKAGPFQVAADKNVGPLAGIVPDPIYGDKQQRFNVYRPSNLASSGYCHPILIWANGMKDNPEQVPPDCVVDRKNQWCGQYLPILSHLASHGFVVVASLSTSTGSGNPLPTIVGLDWIMKQAEDSSSPYYHHLDTVNVGQLGHSFGGMSTCMSASEPRYKALATICGTRALTGVHTPMMFFCGGKDGTVGCDGVRSTFLSVTNQPAFFINELNADHGSWVYQGASGVSLSSAAAWFRVHLMNDTANRKYFYGSGCTFCKDSRVQVEQNSLMAQ